MPHVYKYPVGAKVIYTNEFGVCWGVKTIIKHDEMGLRRTPYKLRPAYHYANSDTPWCPVGEERLQLATETDIFVDDEWPCPQSYFQQKYGRATTLAERHALLDTDPFEGELYA